MRTDAPANDHADYLDRFPAEHRASADRAYNDGFADGACPDLLATAREAADWLCGAPEGTAQRELGDALLAAIALAEGDH